MSVCECMCLKYYVPEENTSSEVFWIGLERKIKQIDNTNTKEVV